MKSKLIIAALLFLFGISCTRNEPVTPSAGKGTPITIQLIPEVPQDIITRGTLNENKIYNAVVLVFSPNDAQFTVQKFDVAGGTNSLLISPVVTGDISGYVVYIAANVGMSTPANDPNFYGNHFNFVGLESDAASHLTAMLSDLNFRTKVSATEDAIPMSAKLTLGGTETGTLTVPLKRVIAKLNYNVTIDGSNPALDNFRIVNVRFGNVPGATYFWERPAQDAPLGDKEYIVSDFFYPAADRRSATGMVYLPENRQGTWGDKSSPTNTSFPDHATYLEFTAETAPGERLYYKVYLGKDNSTNYDVVRNCIYNVNIQVNGINNIASDVRVTVGGNAWYNTDGLLLHYDGINNNGRAKPQVTNQTAKMVNDPYLMRWVSSRFNYSPSYTPTITDYTAETEDARNRWKNIAPDTEGRFCLPLYGFTYDGTCGWGPDCLIFNDNTSYTISGTSTAPAVNAGHGSQCCMVYDDPILRPQQFTIEVVFWAEPGKNSHTEGCDMFAFLLHPGDSQGRYVIAGVEAYPTGLGFIAGTKWNGQNYATGDHEGKKRRVVIQYDGIELVAWYGNRIVYRETKDKSGLLLPWPTGALGTTAVPSMLTLGKFYCSDFTTYPGSNPARYINFAGRIYAFRFYNRVLSKEELDDNFALDVRRFGMPQP